MQFYHEKIVQKVRKAREQGISIQKLGKRFHISETTISRWVRDIRSTNIFYERARIKRENFKTSFHHLLNNISLNSNNAKIFLALLYWCEGSKYPSEVGVAFTNSDWDMAKVFLALLRKGFPIREEKLRARLQVHTTHHYSKVLKFWSELLKIPASQFYKPTITKPTFNMKRQNYMGTCTIKYYDVQVLLQIMGLYEAFAEKMIK